MENKDLNPSDSINHHFGKRVLMLRQEHNWSLEVLSEKSGVSRSMLSKIERGTVNPTLALTIRIARAFGLGLSELVQDQPDEVTGIHLIRSDDEQYHYRSDKHCRIKTLSPLHLEKDIEFYEMMIHKGATLSNPGHYAGTREFLSVTQGKLQVTSDQAELDTPRDLELEGGVVVVAFLQALVPVWVAVGVVVIKIWNTNDARHRQTQVISRNKALSGVDADRKRLLLVSVFVTGRQRQQREGEHS